MPSKPVARCRATAALDIGQPLHGGGALHATAADVLTFFGGAVFEDDPAWELVMTPQRPSPNGVDASTGFLLNIEPGEERTIYSKNGGAPGFSSQVVFTEDPPTVVIVLSNTKDTQGLSDVGRTVITEMDALQ